MEEEEEEEEKKPAARGGKTARGGRGGGRAGAAAAKPKYTPLELQYLAVKREHQDLVLMVEHGYRYRFFGEDAEVAHKVLKVVVYPNKNFLGTSVPTHRVHIHARRLVQAGYKVGIVTQTETAALKAIGSNKSKPMTRALTQVYSKSTLIGQEMDPIVSSTAGGEEGDVAVPDFASMGHYLMCIYEEIKQSDTGGEDDDGNANNAKPKRKKKAKVEEDEANTAGQTISNPSHEVVMISIVAVQTSTGDIVYDTFQDGFMRFELETRLHHINPIEILLPKVISDQTDKVIRNFNPHKRAEEKVALEQWDLDKFNIIMADRTIKSVLQVNISNKANTKTKETKGKSSASKRKTIDSDSDEEEDDEDDEDEEEGGDEQDEEVVQGKQRSAALIGSFTPVLRTAVGTLMSYLKQYSMESLFFLDCNYRHFTQTKYMQLDSNTLVNLEIFQNQSAKLGKGTLFWVMNFTKTMMGRRMLIDWMKKPLLLKHDIEGRLDAVEELTRSSTDTPIGEFLAAFKGLPDLERAICRIYYKKCSVMEFVVVMRAFEMLVAKAPDPSQVESALLKSLVQDLPSIKKDLKYFFSSLSEEALTMQNTATGGNAASVKQTDIFTLEAFPKLAKCKKDIKALEQGLQSHLKEIRKILANPALEFKSVTTQEYLIEVKLNQVSRVPNNWTQVGSTKLVKRYHTPVIKESIPALLQARERLTLEAKSSWHCFLGYFAGKYEKFRRFVNNIAALDTLSSFAQLAVKEGFCRPKLLDASEPQQIKIVNGRHPIIELLIDSSFVPNSIHLVENPSEYRQQHESELDEDSRVDPKAIILTGPNMGGKTSSARQIALISVMAQIGSFVPAEEVVLSPLDGVYTRMGAHDDMMAGQSTFFVELMETSHLLTQASNRSLVILDELGRGTSTHDGVAIAYATLQYLITSISAFTLFITHYPALSRLADKYPNNLCSYHMGFVSEDDKKVIFLYQLVPGVEKRSYGLNVARLANVPDKIINRASHFSSLLENELIERQSTHLFLNLLKTAKTVDSAESVGKTTKLTLKAIQADLAYCQRERTKSSNTL